MVSPHRGGIESSNGRIRLAQDAPLVSQLHQTFGGGGVFVVKEDHRDTLIPLFP